jgi:hypothetical protein
MTHLNLTQSLKQIAAARWPVARGCLLGVLIAVRQARADARAAALILLFGNPVGETAAERDRSIEIVYGLDHPAIGQGFLAAEWSDVVSD